MKILLAVASLILSVTVFGQVNSNTIHFSVNDQPIDERMIGFINPNKIKKIDVLKLATPPEVRIRTKKIHFLSYYDLLDKMNLNGREPRVILNNVEYTPANFLIDRSIIKELDKNEDGDIEIKTLIQNTSRDNRIVTRGLQPLGI